MTELEPADPPFKTCSLAEVAAMVLPPDLKEPEGWLARHLRAGKIRGYKVGRAWRMTEDDIADLIERHRNRADEPDPEPRPTGLSARSLRLRQQANL